MLIALAPIIVQMLLVMIGKVFIESFLTWRATGRWPRNESFIQRTKAWTRRKAVNETYLSPTFA